MARLAKILHITLKKKWFDMIASGEKKEEYREIKGYWWTRLFKPYTDEYGTVAECKHYDYVIARNGYGKNAPAIKWKYQYAVEGKPNPAWCEPEDIDKKVFILKIGEVTRL